MLHGSPRRLWALAAAAGTVAIVALGWVFLISGEKSSRSDLLHQAADTQNQAAISRAKLASLRADNLKLPAYKAQLARLQKALPGGASTAAFVSDMQRLSTASSVAITAINITPPAASDAPAAAAPTTEASATPGAATAPQGTATSTASELPITIAAEGTPTHLEKFLSLLQAEEPRALLLGQVTESAPTGGSAGKVLPTLTVSMKAFYSNS